MKSIKSNKGLTMIDIVIYMITALLVIGMLASVRSFFFKNMDVIKDTAKYAQEFDNFNAYFVKDVKSNEDIVVENLGASAIKLTMMPTGTVYYYEKYEGKNIGDIYRGNVRISTNVKGFSCAKNVIYINNNKKVLLKVTMTIGGNSSDNVVFKKAIQYTFKYW